MYARPRSKSINEYGTESFKKNDCYTEFNMNRFFLVIQLRITSTTKGVLGLIEAIEEFFLNKSINKGKT